MNEDGVLQHGSCVRMFMSPRMCTNFCVIGAEPLWLSKADPVSSCIDGGVRKDLAVKSDEVAEVPVVASHYGWARLRLHAEWQNGIEKLEGGSGKELYPEVLSLYA